MGRKQKQFFYWTKSGYFFPDEMNFFIFHEKVLKASNKIQLPGQILIKIKRKDTHITKKYFGEKNAT